jgi:two-component system NtrC family sensor kinase
VCRHGFDSGVLTEIEVRLPLEVEESSPRNVCVDTAWEGLAHYVPDTSQDPCFIPFPGLGPVSSELCVPIKLGEQLLGVLNIKNTAPNSFAACDQQLLQTLASQTAVALENARLYTEKEHRTNQLSILLKATQDMVSTLDMDSVLEKTTNKIRDFFNAAEVSVLLYQPESYELLFVAVSGPSTDLLMGLRFPATAGIAGWALKERRLVVENNVQRDSRFYKNIDDHTGVTTRSLIAIPLIHREHNIGVIEIVNADAKTFEQLNLETARGMANSATIAIRNAELYRDLQNQMELLQKTQKQIIHSEKMTALGRMVASIAHEINNPLQSIQTYVTLAKEDIHNLKQTNEAQSYLEIVESEIERIATIVHRMRDFYRSSDEEMRLTDLHAVLDSVLTLSGKQLQHSDVAVEREWAADLPHIIAGSNHLKQVFLNLVLNAIDSMPVGGTLCVRTALDRILKDSDLRSRPAVRIEFKDTGEGIPPEILPLLFEPFFTTKQRGTGLGLSIAYNIVEAHNGQLSVESAVGEGTIFTLLLPITGAPPSVSLHAERTPRSSSGPGGKE